MKKNNKGFTLVELIIVVAIFGIFASIAYESYQRKHNGYDYCDPSYNSCKY